MKKLFECPGCHKNSRRVMTNKPNGEKLPAKIYSKCWEKVYNKPAPYKINGVTKTMLKMSGKWK